MSEQAEEMPLNFEREPEPAEAQKPVWREYTIGIGRNLTVIHGMAHSVMDVVSALAGKVRTLAERGPQDYAESDFERGVKAGSKFSSPNNYGGNNNNGQKLGWLMNAAILASLALSAWTLKTVTENTRDIAVIQCQLNPNTCPQVTPRGQP